MPYFNSLARKYTDVTSWEGVGHPSLPNYLALISGSTQGVTSDVTGISFPGVATLGSQLSEAGIPWKAYMENMPGPASEEAEFEKHYAKKHNPFAYFPGTNGPNVVPASQFAADLAEGKLPSFVWYTPNLINDGHDGTNADVDHSLESIVSPVLASAWYKAGGRIIITWDESQQRTERDCDGGDLGRRQRHVVHRARQPLRHLGRDRGSCMGCRFWATPPTLRRCRSPARPVRLRPVPQAQPRPHRPLQTPPSHNHVWREGRALAGFARRRKAPIGTTFSFTLNAPASVSFRVHSATRRAQGQRQVRSADESQPPRARSASAPSPRARCPSRVMRARTGCPSRGASHASKRLALGRYTLSIAATNAAGRGSSSRRLSFSIVR